MEFSSFGVGKRHGEDKIRRCGQAAGRIPLHGKQKERNGFRPFLFVYGILCVDQHTRGSECDLDASVVVLYGVDLP